MANPRQRRKSRSGAANGPSAVAKRHQKKKLVRAPTVKGPEALKDKWDGKKTVRQNYEALGLLPSLSLRQSGGTAPGASTLTVPARSSKAASARPAKGMGRIIRDAEGDVIDIIEGGDEADAETPWGPTMKGWEDEDEEEQSAAGLAEDQEDESEVVQALKAIPDAGPLPRHVSELEAQWLFSLVRKYGDDVDGMFMDKKLNEQQKTKGEIRSR